MKQMFNQKEETRYKNNEFKNMPSIDYYWYENKTELHSLNKHLVDWRKVKEICEKYGLEYTTINDTFCGLRVEEDQTAFCAEVLIFRKIDFDADVYEAWRKSKQYEKMWELERKYHSLMFELHKCVHELDEQTPLAFETGWAGNVGLFGSNDIRRNTYSFGWHLTGWETIIDRWSPSIHDTNSKLKKGVYLFITSRAIKVLEDSETINPKHLRI